MISVSFFHVFIVNNREKYPRGGALAHFYRVGVLNSFFARGLRNRPSKKLPGGMVRLGID